MKNLVFALAVLTAPASAEAEPEVASPPPPEGEAADEDAGETSTDEAPSTAADAGRPVLDRVLPCGTRVLVARDDSLPVASVVLALEHGSEDDPADLPGLEHALAYQLLMGNRDAAPGALQAMVQDAGGIAFLATGPAQIRFESLVPITLLDEVVTAEAHRFRSPTVTESLWQEALLSAKRDVPLRRTTPWEAAAVAHGVPGLAHRPRVVAAALSDLDVAAIESELARRARYEQATLVVVAPLPLEDTLKKVERAFADLPVRTRAVPPRTSSRSAATAPQPKAVGNTFVWAIPGDPASRLWADAWCEAISRQRRAKDEPKPNQVRCAFDDDPRRPTLSIRIRTPGDPRGVLEQRLGRLGDPTTREAERLLRGPRRRIEEDLTTESATPLGLARRLAAAPARAKEALGRSSVEVLTGVAALGEPRPLEALLPMSGAVLVVPAEGSTVPTDAPTEEDAG